MRCSTLRCLRALLLLGLHLSFAPSVGRCAPPNGAWRLDHPVSYRAFASRHTRFSRVPVKSSCLRASFSVPGESSQPGHCGSPSRPTRNERGGALALKNFEDQFAARTLAVYASQRWSPIPPRNTRYRLLAKLCRVGFEPTELLWKVSNVSSLCHLSPPPSFARRYP